ncbi:MAG: Magnesium transporter MgtE [Phycisphaerae bacterium]|nr:Magnesium transporter MgtE [Phycisphaerae bacterium]
MAKQRLGPEDLDEPISRHMSRDVTPLRQGLTVQQALERLRRADLGERIVYFYVTDAEGGLRGVVPTRRLLMSPSDRLIDEVMIATVHSLPESATVLTACESFLQHRFLALPVVDAAGRLVGAIDLSLFTDEVLGLSEQWRVQDVFQLMGMHVAYGQRRSPARGFAMRFPWLLCNIVGGILCALLAGRFESLLGSTVVLALFVPVVLALAESVSIQSMTLTLQSLHGKAINWPRFRRTLSAEFLTACLLGLGGGLIVGGTALLWRGQWHVAAAIGVSICLSMITACLLGVLLPSAVRLFRGDPKIASGPIVLAAADLLTLLFYFTLAGWLLT